MEESDGLLSHRSKVRVLLGALKFKEGGSMKLAWRWKRKSKKILVIKDPEATMEHAKSFAEINQNDVIEFFVNTLNGDRLRFMRTTKGEFAVYFWDEREGDYTLL